MKWIPDDVVMLKKMETMNKHDLYDYIFNHSDAFVFVCKSSIDLLHLKRSLKGVEEESFEKEESFNKRLDSVMGELLIEEMDAYNVQNMQIADFLDTAENMKEEEYNYLNMLTYYMERLKCYPSFYVFEYRTQEVKKAYFDAVDLIVKYRELHWNQKPSKTVDVNDMSDEELDKILAQAKQNVKKVEKSSGIAYDKLKTKDVSETQLLNSGWCLAKSCDVNIPKRWFKREEVINGCADEYDNICVKFKDKTKPTNCPVGKMKEYLKQEINDVKKRRGTIVNWDEKM